MQDTDQLLGVLSFQPILQKTTQKALYPSPVRRLGKVSHCTRNVKHLQNSD